MLRRIAMAGATAIAAVGFGLAHAGSAGAATYTVCGYGTIVPIHGGGPGCMTMATAIADAQASPEADVIRMLPGTYCPIDLEGTFAQPIKFIGVGFAGEDLSGGPVSFNGPEASLTTISDDSVHCDPATYDIQVNTHVFSSAPMVFQNITADGTSGGEYGFHQAGVNTYTVLRDDIFEHFSGQFGWGVYFQSGFAGFNSSTTLELDNSAVINNTYGVDLEGAEASVYDTTIAGNTNTGLILENYDVSLGGDTISHNRTGVTAPTGGSGMQIVDTIVAGNTSADCSNVSDWEFGGGFEPGSFGNLVGSFSCPINQGSAHGDVRNLTLTDLTMPAVGLNGGPTPSALPPPSAQGIDAATCPLNGTDQREYSGPSGNTCDAGSVQSGGSSAGSVNAGNLDLQTVTANVTTHGTVSVSPSGAGLVGVSGVSISGSSWSVSDDECTWMIMVSSFFAPIRSCTVGVAVHPTSVGNWNGTLTVHTTEGDVTAHLHAQVVPPPSISGFGPTAGPVGTSVVISGSSFTGATAVTFGGTDAQSFHVDSDTQITAVVAAGTRTGVVSVSTSAGTDTTTRFFVVTSAPPAIRLFNPGQGSAGDTITILGSNLAGATAVTFGGVAAVTFSAAAGSITVTVPVGAATGHIAVTTPGGTATSVGVFTVIPAVAPAPTITSFSPGSGIHGVRVTIRGSGFTGTTQVTFNGKTASFTVVNDSTITAIVPTGATTGPIKVTTPGGTATSVANFSI